MPGEYEVSSKPLTRLVIWSDLPLVPLKRQFALLVTLTRDFKHRRRCFYSSVEKRLISALFYLVFSELKKAG